MVPCEVKLGSIVIGSVGDINHSAVPREPRSNRVGLKPEPGAEEDHIEPQLRILGEGGDFVSGKFQVDGELSPGAVYGNIHHFQNHFMGNSIKICGS